MNYKDLLHKLPTSWEELKLKDYLKVTDIVLEEGDGDNDLFVGVDNTLKVIAVLVDTPVEQLEDLPFQHVQELAKRIEFISELPKPQKRSSIEWRRVEEIRYNDFVMFLQLSKDPIRNLPAIIQTFSKNDLTEEQALELNVQDAYTGFFLLRKRSRKYVRRTVISLSLRLIRLIAKDWAIRCKQKINGWLRKSKKPTGGTS